MAWADFAHVEHHASPPLLFAILSRKAELVKLRYFGGFTLEEAADALGISVPTAKRDWTYARAWLFKEIGQRGGS